MKILKTRGKVIKKSNITKINYTGGSIDHLISVNNNTGGNITELKKALSHLVIKPKTTKKVSF